jgi:prepilin-type N-terminal cleavage/methylation domain-containing protein
MKNVQGFSLVEVLIVVAIIAILGAIAVPSLLTSRQAANEAAAMQGCRTIGSAEISYAATNNQQYTDLASLVSGSYLDSRFGTPGAINGYTFEAGDVAGTTVDGDPPASFGFIATPTTGSGRFQYSIGPDQVVRYQGVVGSATLPAGVAVGDPIGKSD